MDAQPQAGPVSEKPSLEAWCAFEVAKANIMTRQQALIDAISEADLRISLNGGHVDEDDRRIVSVKIATMALFALLKNKLGYPRHTAVFQPLKNLFPYARGERNVCTMPYREAKKHAELLFTFCEVDGITKFEKQTSEKTDFVGELTE
jgi:hypothetical protein